MKVFVFLWHFDLEQFGSSEDIVYLSLNTFCTTEMLPADS